MPSPNDEGKQWSPSPASWKHKQAVFLLPSASLLHSSFLAACTQPVEVRETPLGMSDKHIFEMTRSFHVLACHKACECAVCRLRQGRVKDLQWPKAPGSLPNKLPVALNLQHTTTHHTLLLTCIHADVHVSLI